MEGGVDGWWWWRNEQGGSVADCGTKALFCAGLYRDGNRVIMIQSLLAKLKPTETGSLGRKTPAPESD